MKTYSYYLAVALDSTQPQDPNKPGYIQIPQANMVWYRRPYLSVLSGGAWARLAAPPEISRSAGDQVRLGITNVASPLPASSTVQIVFEPGSPFPPGMTADLARGVSRSSPPRGGHAVPATVPNVNQRGLKIALLVPANPGSYSFTIQVDESPTERYFGDPEMNVKP